MGRHTRCTVCKITEEADLTCSICRSVVYCSRTCQRSHWKKHKHECRELAAAAELRAQREAAKEAKILMSGFRTWLQGLCRAPLAALPPPPEGGCEDCVVCAPAQPRRRRVECAGTAFLETFERSSSSFKSAASAGVGGAEAKEARKKAPKEVPNAVQAKKANATKRAKPHLQYCAERAERRSKLLPNKAQLTKRLYGVELYALLGIEVDDDAFPTDEQVREAYKKMVLIHHPDKKASKSLAFQLIQEAYEYLSDADNKQMYDSTLPFNDALPTQEDVRRKGFFQALGPAFQRNAKWSERQPVPDLGGLDEKAETVHAFYNWWYHFESWRDVGPRYLEKHGLELEDLQGCPREERRARQKQNEQVRKQFDAHERLRILRLVDLAWQNDPRIAWQKATKTKGAADAPPTRTPKASAQVSDSNRQSASKEEAEAERRKREEVKKVAKSRRQNLRKCVEGLGLLVSGVELDRYCLKVEGDALELEDLQIEVERLAALRAEDVTEELTETDEEEVKKSKGEEAEVAMCTFCNGSGRNAVSKQDCMFCDGTGRQKVEEVAPEPEETKPEKEKRYRRKTPRQLAQEVVFDAMWAAGLRPTETRHSPELREERRRRAEAEREERRRRREQRQKELQADTKAAENAQAAPEEEPAIPEEDFANAVARKEARWKQKRAHKAQFATGPEVIEFHHEDRARTDRGGRDEKEEEEELVISSLETDPTTIDKIAKLTEFARIGGTVEAASQVVLAAISASPEMRRWLGDLEERRLTAPEDYADEVLSLLSECVAPFFSLGLRPSGIQLPPVVRNRAKRVRQALRDLVIGCSFLQVLDEQRRR